MKSRWNNLRNKTRYQFVGHQLKGAKFNPSPCHKHAPPPPLEWVPLLAGYRYSGSPANKPQVPIFLFFSQPGNHTVSKDTISKMNQITGRETFRRGTSAQFLLLRTFLFRFLWPGRPIEARGSNVRGGILEKMTTPWWQTLTISICANSIVTSFIIGSLIN